MTGLYYQLRYPELNYRSKERPWSIRQTGMYHQRNDECDLFIVVNPVADSNFETQLMALTHAGERKLASYADSPMSIHALLLRSYVSNWRWCLKSWGILFERMVSKMSSRIHEVRG